MMGAGEGMAKGGSGAGASLEGMGLGVGFGMAQMFARQTPVAPAAPPPSDAGSGKSVTDRLKEIHELHKAGILTDDEYDSKKSELMKLL
jgi:hypothetical protein